MVDRLKDQLIDFFGLLVFKADAHHLQSICKALYTNADGSVSLVRHLSLLDWVMISINDHIQVFGYPLCNLMQLIIVELLCLGIYESR